VPKEEAKCVRARLDRLRENSFGEPRSVRARLQSCRKRHKIARALAPEGCFSGISLGFRPFSAASSIVPKEEAKCVRARLESCRKKPKRELGFSPCNVKAVPANEPGKRHRMPANILYNHPNRGRKIALPNRTHGERIDRIPAINHAPQKDRLSRLRRHAQSSTHPCDRSRRDDS